MDDISVFCSSVKCWTYVHYRLKFCGIMLLWCHLFFRVFWGFILSLSHYTPTCTWLDVLIDMRFQKNIMSKDFMNIGSQAQHVSCSVPLHNTTQLKQMTLNINALNNYSYILSSFYFPRNMRCGNHGSDTLGYTTHQRSRYKLKSISLPDCFSFEAHVAVLSA